MEIPERYPTMQLSSNSEGELVKRLAARLSSSSLSTKIVVYDHNWDNLDYARQILSSNVASLVYGKVNNMIPYSQNVRSSYLREFS